jgi:hypothetical protein
MIRLFALVAAGFALAASATPARADIIFDNGTPDLTNAFNSDFFNFGFQSADDFVLAPGASTITDLHWWGVYAFTNTPNAADNFTIRIFADAGGAPDINPFVSVNVGNVSRTFTGDNVVGFDVYEYDVDVAPIALAPGTTYWLSIVNDSANNPGGDGWFWATSDGLAGNGHQRFGDGVGWDIAGAEFAFNLTGAAIPEPASLAVFGALAAGAFGLRRRPRAGA